MLLEIRRGFVDKMVRLAVAFRGHFKAPGFPSGMLNYEF
jgi:hypothetical protein